MEDNLFIKQHIQCDKRLNLSNSLYNRIEKQEEFLKLLKLITSNNIYTILNYLQQENIIFKNAMNINNFKYYINQLVAVEFVEQIETPKLPPEIIAYLNEYNYYKMSYYSLTKKGKDFLDIDYVKEFMAGGYNE